MNILILYNDFNGAYGSLEVFQKELSSLPMKNDCIFTSRTVEETIRYCRKYVIDFSIGIGAFHQYCGVTPIYDITNIPHFQWIIDNPLKMNIDTQSSRITYILIDHDFTYNLALCKNPPIFIPLGFDGEIQQISDTHKEEGIVFSGQIKDCNNYKSKILEGSHKKQIYTFLDDYENRMDDSFEMIFHQYFGLLPLEEQKQIFKLVNSYFRAKKRKNIIESIKDYPVYIIGNVTDNAIIRKKNVHIIPEMSYEATWKMMSKYMFSLNVNPNFHDSVHDRVLRSVAAGTMPVTERCDWCFKIFENAILYYTYQDLSVESIISECKPAEYHMKLCDAREKAGALKWNAAIEKMKEWYNRGKIRN